MWMCKIYGLRMKFPECSSVQGHQWNCFFAIFLCHLVHLDPVLPPIRILLEPRAFHSSDTQSYLHLHFLPSKKWPKGELPLGSCSRPKRVSPGVRAIWVTLGTCVQGNLLGVQVGQCQVVIWEEQGWDALKPLPWGRRGHIPSLLIGPPCR